jgi:uncharacterized membrane protein
MSISRSLELSGRKKLPAALDKAVHDLDLDRRVADFGDAVAELADRLPAPLAGLVEPALPPKRSFLAKLFAPFGLDGVLPRSWRFAGKALSLPSRTRKGEIAPALAELGHELEGLAKLAVDLLPAPLAELTPLRTPAGAAEPAGSWNLFAITAPLFVVGPLHFLIPKQFDRIVPPKLPGSARLWTYLSGIAEIGVGVLLVIPRTRRLGGLAAASLFAAVYPANVQMAKDFTGKGVLPETIAFGRLPLQFPLLYGALKIAITGK